MEIIEFQPDHLARLQVQEEQSLDISNALDNAEAIKAASAGAWSAVEGDAVLGCIGVFRTAENRMTAWGLLGRMGAINFFKVHQRVRNFLEAQQAPIRIEATVFHGHAPAHQWMDKLGFVLETPEGMRGYMPDGGTCDLYAYVKGASDAPKV